MSENFCLLEKKAEITEAPAGWYDCIFVLYDNCYCYLYFTV